ncbi:unnamed protein product [Cuscuta campestris]|uniref:NB-ARC domain-containing protein n=1 Tax=Cuscuta campestris TaxID=132261 RepID=A0A484K6D7_9ASTE|nr:unnamed protein product [Cuscuta campestris]
MHLLNSIFPSHLQGQFVHLIVFSELGETFLPQNYRIEVLRIFARAIRSTLALLPWSAPALDPPAPNSGCLVWTQKDWWQRVESAPGTCREKELDVFSIICMPGLGKTTLAWKIFENEDISYQFPIRIWVYVSQSFNNQEVFLTILRKFTSSSSDIMMSGLCDEELAQSLRVFLSKEKFLLVMDDVWSLEDWNVIKNMLPSSNRLSKVMITSREKIVGGRAKVCTDPHMLCFFTVDERCRLLQLEVFGNNNGEEEEDRCCPLDLRDIGLQIAGQCYGVLLTVVVVGGILVDLFVKTHAPRLLKKEWENVSENVSKFIQNDLRECCLHMAVFPEEHVVPSWMLTRLWIVEGFVRPREKFGRSCRAEPE